MHVVSASYRSVEAVVASTWSTLASDWDLSVDERPWSRQSQAETSACSFSWNAGAVGVVWSLRTSERLGLVQFMPGPLHWAVGQSVRPRPVGLEHAVGNGHG